jgi:hypothetical protein
VFFTTYAIALYADPKDVRSALSSFKVSMHPAPSCTSPRMLFVCTHLVMILTGAITRRPEEEPSSV